jgi:hypothetical protein
MCAWFFVLENGAQQHRDAAGFSCAGAAQDGAVLADQLIHLDHCRNAAILREGPDRNRLLVAPHIGASQLVGRRCIDRVAERRITEDAAQERAYGLVVVFGELTDQLKLRHADFRLSVPLRRNRDAQGRNETENDAARRVDLENRAEFGAPGRAHRKFA